VPPSYLDIRGPAAGEHAQILGQAGLADACLTEKEHEPSSARDRAVHPGAQCGQLAIAAEQRRIHGCPRRRHVA
jgi:hypothetical protein